MLLLGLGCFPLGKRVAAQGKTGNLKEKGGSVQKSSRRASMRSVFGTGIGFGRKAELEGSGLISELDGNEKQRAPAELD